MEWYEYLIIIVAIVFVITIFIIEIKKKKNGHSSCSEYGCPHIDDMKRSIREARKEIKRK